MELHLNYFDQLLKDFEFKKNAHLPLLEKYSYHINMIESQSQATDDFTLYAGNF